MTPRLWPALCALLAAWSVFATWKWRQAAVNAPARSPVFADEAVADLERVTFQRQFADQLLTYDDGTYWRNQTALAFLMAPDLREEKLRELETQADKRRQAEFRQQARLSAIRRAKDGTFAWVGSLEGKEGARAWNLDFDARIQLGETARTLENPWGLEVRALALKSEPRKGARPEGRLFLEAGKAAVVSFPCLVENVAAPENPPVKIKITSLRTSEIQFVSTEGLNDIELTALCPDLKFPLKLVKADGVVDVFRRLEREDGAARFGKTTSARKTKESYRKTLEDELGFVIDE